MVDVLMGGGAVRARRVLRPWSGVKVLHAIVVPGLPAAYGELGELGAPAAPSLHGAARGSSALSR